MKIVSVLIMAIFLSNVVFAQGVPSQQQGQSISPSSMVAVDSQNVQVTYTRKIPVSQLQIQCLNEQTQVAQMTTKMNADCAQSAQMVTATSVLANTASTGLITSTTTTATTGGV